MGFLFRKEYTEQSRFLICRKNDLNNDGSLKPRKRGLVPSKLYYVLGLILLISTYILAKWKLLSNVQNIIENDILTISFKYLHLSDEAYANHLDDSNIGFIMGYSISENFYIHTLLQSDSDLEVTIEFPKEGEGYPPEKEHYLLGSLDLRTSFYTSSPKDVHKAFFSIRHIDGEGVDKMLYNFDNLEYILHVRGKISVRRMGMFYNSYDLDTPISPLLLFHGRGNEPPPGAAPHELAIHAYPRTEDCPYFSPWDNNYTYSLSFGRKFKTAITHKLGTVLYMEAYTKADTPQSVGSIIIDTRKIPEITSRGIDGALGQELCSNCNTIFIPDSTYFQNSNHTRGEVPIVLKNIQIRPSDPKFVTEKFEAYESTYDYLLLSAINSSLEKKAYGSTLIFHEEASHGNECHYMWKGEGNNVIE